MASSKRRSLRSRRDNRHFYLFISPFLIGFSVFTLVPMLVSLYFSFHKISLLSFVDGTYTFYGIKNYINTFADNDYFLYAIRNTFVFAFARNVFCVLIALGLAVFFNRKMPGKKFFRTLIYIPGVLPIVGAAIIWRQLFDGRSSIISWLLSMIGIHVEASWWLGNGGLISAIIMSVIMGIGQNMTMFLAALQGVPENQIEAAKLDGAGAVARFFKIVMPNISPTAFYVVLTGFISSLQAYAEVELLVGSLAKNSVTMSYLVMDYYNRGMIGLGYSSALAWMLCIITAIFSFFVFRYSKKMVFFADGDQL